MQGSGPVPGREQHGRYQARDDAQAVGEQRGHGHGRPGGTARFPARYRRRVVTWKLWAGEGEREKKMAVNCIPQPGGRE